jgi:hypothetical protein
MKRHTIEPPHQQLTAGHIYAGIVVAIVTALAIIFGAGIVIALIEIAA